MEEPPGETDVAARAPWLDRVPALVLPGGAEPEISTFRAALEKFHRGLVVVDANLRILFANAGARRILERGDALQVEAGMLGFRSRDAWLKVRDYAAMLAAGLAERSGATTASAGLALRLDRLPQAAPYRAWVSGLSEAVAALDEAAAELRDEVLNMLGVRVGYRGELADECPGSRAHPNPRSLSRFVVWQSAVSRATILTI